MWKEKERAALRILCRVLRKGKTMKREHAASYMDEDDDDNAPDPKLNLHECARNGLLKPVPVFGELRSRADVCFRCVCACVSACGLVGWKANCWLVRMCGVKTDDK